MDALFSQLLPGAQAMMWFRVESIDGVTGARLLTLLDSVAGADMGNTTITPSTGDTSGHIDNPPAAHVRVVKQVFVAGDIIREPNGSTHVVLAMSGDNATAYTNSAHDQGYPSAEVVRVGHVDPATLSA